MGGADFDFSGRNDSKVQGEWNILPEHMKASILKGLEEADAGLGRPFEEVTQEIREKYDIPSRN